MAKKRKKTARLSKLTAKEQRAIWDSNRVNLYLGHPLRDKLHGFAALATARRGTRVSISEIMRRIIEQMTQEDIKGMFPDNRRRR